MQHSIAWGTSLVIPTDFWKKNTIFIDSDSSHLVAFTVKEQLRMIPKIGS